MISRALELRYPACKRSSAKMEWARAREVYPSCCDDTVDLHLAVDSEDCNLSIFAKLRWRMSLLLNLLVDLSSSVEQSYVVQDVFRTVCSEQCFPCRDHVKLRRSPSYYSSVVADNICLKQTDEH